MASDWSEVSLGDLIEVKHGYPFEGEFFRDVPPGDVLLTPGNFAIGGGFKADKLKYYVGPVPDEYVLRENELIVTMTDLSKRADTLGYPALVPRNEDSARFLHNQRLGKVVVKPNVDIEKRFLYYLLCSREYRNEVIASATGTTVKHTSPTRICNFRFRLPSKKEQRAVATLLGTLDDRISLNQRKVSNLEAVVTALFESWFVEFSPVRIKAEGGTVELPKRLGDLFSDSIEIAGGQQVPKRWNVCALDEIARFVNGLALQRYPPSNGRALPVIKIAQIRAGHTTGADAASADLPPDFVVNDGDVLFSWSGSLECVLWAGGEGALNQHLFKVTSSKYPKWFYFSWVRHHLPEFRHIAAAKATTMGHIQRHHLSAAKVLVPPLDLLSAANQHLEPLIDSIVHFKLLSRTLATVRNVLLPKLISGELRVSDAERIVGVLN